MKTFDIDTHSLLGVGVTIGIVAFIVGAIWVFLPEFSDSAFDKALSFLDLIPNPFPK